MFVPMLTRRKVTLFSFKEIFLANENNENNTADETWDVLLTVV